MQIFINQLNEKEIRELNDVFREIDKDNSGKINFEELKQAMEKSNIQITETDLNNIFATFSSKSVDNNN